MIIITTKSTIDANKSEYINYYTTKLIINLTEHSILIRNKNRVLLDDSKNIVYYIHTCGEYFYMLTFSDNYAVSCRTKINLCKYEYYKIFFYCKNNMIKILYFFKKYFIRNHSIRKYYNIKVIHEIKIFNSEYNYFITNYIIAT